MRKARIYFSNTVEVRVEIELGDEEDIEDFDTQDRLIEQAYDMLPHLCSSCEMGYGSRPGITLGLDWEQNGEIEEA